MRAIRLAKEATNGWAVYAKRKAEHDNIAHLHREIAAVERDATTKGDAAGQMRSERRLWTRRDRSERRPTYRGSELKKPKKKTRLEPINAFELLIRILERERATLREYLDVKAQAEDWHAVADAAMDLRELDARMKTLRNER